MPSNPEYPSQKCIKCGNEARFETIDVCCNGQWLYKYRCVACKQRTTLKGVDPNKLVKK